MVTHSAIVNENMQRQFGFLKLRYESPDRIQRRKVQFPYHDFARNPIGTNFGSSLLSLIINGSMLESEIPSRPLFMWVDFYKSIFFVWYYPFETSACNNNCAVP
jgi:hypothetical protein